MQYQVRIQAGTLTIQTNREEMPLTALTDFASRQNPKRGFLFVSKVLGKHIPCRPSLMRQVYERLARQLRNLPSPVVIVGMAETATGLGGGVAHSLARSRNAGTILYLHTTRHYVNAPVLATFDEHHSHAPNHILYLPQQQTAALFREARSLVLVDDEISTGRTLSQLVVRLMVHMVKLEQLVFASIVNWLNQSQRQTLQKNLSRQVRFASLLDGEFQFQPNPAYQPLLPCRVSARQPSRFAQADTGRTGVLMMPGNVQLPEETIDNRPLVLVGTGEFAFAPFLAAEELERRGYDVLFQSTTRSPILVGEAIQCKLVFWDEHGEGVMNYLYNLPNDRQVIVAYEHPHMAALHDLPVQVNAQVWTLARGGTNPLLIWQ